MTAETTAPGRASSIGLYSGLAFVVLFVLSFLMLGTPGSDASDETWLAHWQDKGNRIDGLVSTFAMGLAAIAFLWFLGAVRRRLPAGTIGADAAYGAGIAYATLAFVACLGAGLIPVGSQIVDVPVPVDVDLIRIVDGMFFGTIFLPMGFAAAAMLFPLSHAASVSGLLPRWLVVFGYVTAAVNVVGMVTFIAAPLLLMVWVASVSVILLRRT